MLRLRVLRLGSAWGEVIGYGEEAMVDCCRPAGIETRFDEKYVVRKLERYRKKGPKTTTSILTAVLKREMDGATSLLDIGGGVGDIQHELLGAGVRTSTNCEVSAAFVQACMEEAERQGHVERITHIRGDFVEVAADVPAADIVTLDRVICCYPNMPDLVRVSLAKTQRLYGIVLPLERWWVKLATMLYYNLRFLLQGNPFRVFVHPTAAVESLILGSGFERVFYRVKGPWQSAVYSRSQ